METVVADLRASAWVLYDQLSPPPHVLRVPASSQIMDESPGISTLRENSTPPPVTQPAKTSTGVRSVKLLVKDQPPQEPQHPFDILASTAAQSASLPIQSTTSGETRKRRLSQLDEDVPEEDEIEEDQLIDDEPTPEASSKKKSPTKPKTKKEKKDKAPKVTKITLQLGAPPSGPGSSVDAATDKADSVEPPAKKKKTAPKKQKTPAASKGTKTQLGPKLKLLPPQLAEDVASVASEGYTGTAASSPVNTHFEHNSPAPDDISAPLPPPTLAGPEHNQSGQSEDIAAQLEGVPIPSYPLPTKPFPVMPPPKLSTGMAPSLTLDKSGKKVRHWRTALREIRGIGGGRWFARTWVGDKESQYAASIAASKGTLLDNVSVASMSVSPEKPSGLSKLAAAASASAPVSTTRNPTPTPVISKLPSSSTSVFSAVPSGPVHEGVEQTSQEDTHHEDSLVS